MALLSSRSLRLRSSGFREAGGGARPQVVGERATCGLCGESRGRDEVEVPCHVRAFVGESFRVWRCGTCRTLHCREMVDLGHYYAQYPFARARLTWPFRMFYRRQIARLRRQGLEVGHRILDYGCGNGRFVKYLRSHGFPLAMGYDPYGAPDRFGDPEVLRAGSFDYVVLQDVLEHVEDPRQLLARLDGLLRPGGTVLVGTPDAERIDLQRPGDYLNELHVPYHLHIYPRAVVTRLAWELGWETLAWYARPYHDLPFPGLNTAMAKHYQRLCDGTLDCLLEPVQAPRLLLSPGCWWYGLVGFWVASGADMALVFRKIGSSPKRGVLFPPKTC